MVVLAHGSLGYWDELIFLGVVVVFVMLMVVSWIRSRTTQPQLPQDNQAEMSNEPDHFQLD
ncbi:MAG: hypothetical protein CUN56_06620 [Phototrophicales bacterium]|nr:MAG: hypothetical protein CUN56_06620 [Phototrophicales bacterium]RMG76337.1 MAG: hypothetical protein D6711_04220 [Chloroflexota bacterium]